MNKNYYELYKASVYSLAETLVIKSEDTASTMNDLIKATYGDDAVDPYDPTTWKYYKNICGYAHSTDPVITVVSLDTLQNITFSRENLSLNPATRKAFQYGTRNYNELVSLFPDQEMLILGVLYPADMTKAIAAEDGSIVSYPEYLVEPNEVSLIANLNEFLRVFKARWWSQQFGVSDSLFTTAWLGVLYLQLVPAIMNLRLQACKTPEAHSFHIRQYLASHGMLDVYFDVLTMKQYLFFYRNILYIERNNGKRHVFEWLVEHIMTERNMPVAELVMKHDVSGMPTSLRPGIDFKVKHLNKAVNVGSLSDYSLDQVLTKESFLADGNPEYIDANSESIKTTLLNSLSSVVATKVLESSLIDYTDATPYTLYEICLNNWLYRSAVDDYDAYVNFKNARTGETITLHCKDAFTYFAYTISKAVGANPTTIPQFIALRILRSPRPNASDLLTVVDRNYITSADAQAILGLMPLVVRATSVAAFNSDCLNLFKMAQDHLKLVGIVEHQYRRGLMQGMVNRLYSDRSMAVEPTGTTWEAWLASKNLPTTAFTGEEYIQMNKDIFEAATGSTVDSTAGTRALQTAMVSMMEDLSSYSIQFVKEVNGSNLRLLNWAAVRVGDIVTTGEGIVLMPDFGSDVVEQNGNTRHDVQVESNVPYVKVHTPSAFNQSEELDMKVKVSVNTYDNKKAIDVLTGSLFVGVSHADPDLNDPNYFIGYEDFFANFAERGDELRSIYDVVVGERPGLGSDISGFIINNVLTGLAFTGIPKNMLEVFEFEPITGTTPGLISDPSEDSVTNGFSGNSTGETVLNAFVSPNEST